MGKDFDSWNKKKKRLDESKSAPPLVSEGDFWWCSIGENVGVEIGGKSENFTRPVVILKKFGRLGFLAVPTTTKERVGTWYVSFKHGGIGETAMLSQTRLLSYKRLDRKMGELAETDFHNVKQAYIRLFQ